MSLEAPLPAHAVSARNPASDRAQRLTALGRAACAGDEAALGQLLRALAPDMLRVIRSVLGAKSPEAEDVLQDCLLGFTRALVQFRFESSVSTFALTIAFRQALAAKRRHIDVARWNDAFHRMNEPLAEAPAIEDLDIERRRSLVAELLRTIPAAQAETLGLRAVVGLSIEEIAAATAVPANTVRSRLRLAKEALRRAIEADPNLRDFLEPMS